MRKDALLFLHVLLAILLNSKVGYCQQVVEDPWSIGITVTLNGTDNHVYFGNKVGATDVYDGSPIDTLAPPPPPEGFYTYFLISGVPNLTDRLSRDYRSASQSSNIWTLKISRTEGNGGTISWDSQNFPTGTSSPGSLTIDGVDMLSQNSMSFTGDQTMTLHFTAPLNKIVCNVKIYLEGCYSSGSMNKSLKTLGFLPLAQPYNHPPWNYAGTESVSSIPNEIVDWVLVELRSGTSPETIVGTRAAFLESDGLVMDLDGLTTAAFSSVSPGSYYIVIRHRNHLAIMSKSPVAMNATSALYDFTTGQDEAYGTNPMQQLTASVYGMYAGDADGSGDIGALDRAATWNFRNQSGYLPADVDLSGDVGALDRAITWNNRNRVAQVP